MIYVQAVAQHLTTTEKDIDALEAEDVNTVNTSSTITPTTTTTVASTTPISIRLLSQNDRQMLQQHPQRSFALVVKRTGSQEQPEFLNLKTGELGMGKRGGFDFSTLC